MPKTSVKTKAPEKAKGKAHARSPFEPGHGSSKPVTDDSDVEMDGDEPGDEGKKDKEERKKEKDEAEKKLERMLFGDDEGFQGALTAQRDRGLMALVAQSDEDISEGEDGEGGDGDEDDERGLEDVADADVCSPLVTLCACAWVDGWLTE